jgi:eukaryotic-like serine/threonine-protein kinase
MTPEEYAQAKQEFFRIIDLNEVDQKQAIVELAKENTDLAREVQGLVDNHRSRTIIRGFDATKEKKDDSTSHSTLTRGFRRLRFSLVGGIAPMATLLAVTLLFALIGFMVHYMIQRRLEVAKRSQLITLIDLQQDLLEQWSNAVSLKVETWARSPKVREAVAKLVEVAKNHQGSDRDLCIALNKEPAQLDLDRELNELSGLIWPKGYKQDTVAPENCQKYAIWDQERRTLADWNRRNIPGYLGRRTTNEGAAKINNVFQSARNQKPSTFIYPPRTVTEERITEDYPMETNQPQIQVLTPVFDENRKPIAVLMIRDQGIFADFQDAIAKGRFEQTGECYLMDEDGWMMNEPRCVDIMRKHDAFQPYCNQGNKRYSVRVADPGGSVFSGYSPDEPILQWPRTVAARKALAKVDGEWLTPYRDFVGRKVIGAWRWNPTLNSALVVEQEYNEAFQPLSAVEWIGRLTWGVPLCGAIGLAVASVIRNFRRKGKSPTRLGPYRILEKIGEGGIGVVYKGEHRLLNRITAVKLLKKSLASESALKRFEREVRLTAKLSHPNAINIFDYGLSEDGSFYYAMEYIEGANLAEFHKFMKTIPFNRLLHILIQTCEAIREAHGCSIVHRDIKPQNIMVSNRGGLPDMVKVLDYGLVKSFASPSHRPHTETSFVIGTPRFMAPERIASPWLADPRIDIYSIGTVTYYLMFAHTPLIGIDFAGVKKIADSEASRYRELANEASFLKFLDLIAKCINPEPRLRPPTIDAVLEVLCEVQKIHPWDYQEAHEWWIENKDKLIEYGRGLRKEMNSPEQLLENPL